MVFTDGRGRREFFFGGSVSNPYRLRNHFVLFFQEYKQHNIVVWVNYVLPPSRYRRGDNGCVLGYSNGGIASAASSAGRSADLLEEQKNASQSPAKNGACMIRTQQLPQPTTMTKALLVLGTLCAFATVDAFVAKCPRVATPAACAQTSSSAVMNRAHNRVRMQLPQLRQTAAGRTARTELFSTPAAASEELSPAKPAAVKKEAKATPSTLKVTAYFGLWYLFNIGYVKS